MLAALPGCDHGPQPVVPPQRQSDEHRTEITFPEHTPHLGIREPTGKLQDATIAQWRAATETDRLETCKDWVTELYRKQWGNSSDPSDLAKRVSKFNAALTKTIEGRKPAGDVPVKHLIDTIGFLWNVCAP
jgi:hypothetical protein